jgi:hypothetical protein
MKGYASGVGREWTEGDVCSAFIRTMAPSEAVGGEGKADLAPLQYLMLGTSASKCTYVYDEMEVYLFQSCPLYHPRPCPVLPLEQSLHWAGLVPPKSEIRNQRRTLEGKRNPFLIDVTG